jgi:hypothetical protein
MGFRIAGVCHVYKWDAEHPQRPQRLDMRNDLRNHSATGPEWGYCGSGPAQLALALVADALDDDGRALDIYQRVKTRLQVMMPRDCWSLTQDQVCGLVLEVEQDHCNEEERLARLNSRKEGREG